MPAMGGTTLLEEQGLTSKVFVNSWITVVAFALFGVCFGFVFQKVQLEQKARMLLSKGTEGSRGFLLSRGETKIAGEASGQTTIQANRAQVRFP